MFGETAGEQLVGLPRHHRVVEQFPGIFELQEAAFEFGGEVADGKIRVGNLSQQRGGEADHGFQLAQMGGEFFGGGLGLDDFAAFLIQELPAGPRPKAQDFTRDRFQRAVGRFGTRIGRNGVHAEKMPEMDPKCKS